MHAPRRAAGTSRRHVSRRHGRYSVCGLARTPKRPARGFFWTSGVLYAAIAVCAFWVSHASPLEQSDPTHGALVARFTFEDFANASR